ncbi:MAG: trypsin-like peptidase domain-containing protein, partial [Myxococcota bacterium]|nr:trypsin-like peptidase domain-containing protein [Myxococcota bacterium]
MPRPIGQVPAGIPARANSLRRPHVALLVERQEHDDGAMQHEHLSHSSRPRARRAGLAVLALAVGLGGAGATTAITLPSAISAQDAAPRGATSAPPTSGPAAQAAIADAERVGSAFATVAEQVSPSVVSIRVEARVDRAEMMQQMPFGAVPGMPGGGGGDEQIVQGGGSGFVVSADGAILTNRHVVENATRIRVRFQDGRELPATVVGIDRATDLAVVRVEATGLRPLRFASMDQQRVGQWVIAIGSPFGLDTTITAGVLSATGRGGLGMNEIEDYLQTDASINPGNSGGPLVNLDGEVVGINTMIIGRGQGIGFAIPADMAQNVSQQLLASGRVRRAWIGVGFQELTPELAADFGVGGRRGALVNEIVPNGPAARAGIQSGDVIINIEGVPVRESRDLMRLVIRRPVGVAVRLEVMRAGRPMQLTLTTGERPDASAEEPQDLGATQPTRDDRGFGVQLVPVTPQVARQIGYAGRHGAV